MASPQWILTFIHGTWGIDSEWIRNSSKLYSILHEQFGQRIILAPTMRWSGRNSHSARLRAADHLRDHILNVSSLMPQARQILVAHSHGGNVAALAIRDPNIRSRIAGVVTLGTPFVIVAPRGFESIAGELRPAFDRIIPYFVTCLVGAMFGLAFYLAIGRHMGQVTHPEITAVGYLLLGAGVGILGWQIGLFTMTRLSSFGNKLALRLIEKTHSLAGTLGVNSIEEVPLLNVVVKYDEPRTVLGGMSRLVDYLLSEHLRSIASSLAFAAMTVAAWIMYAQAARVETSDLERVLIILLLHPMAVVTIMVPLFFLLVLAAIWTISWLLQNNPLNLGWSSPVIHLLLSVHVEEDPIYWARRAMLRIEIARPWWRVWILRHSLIYNDTGAAKGMAEWMRLELSGAETGDVPI